MHNRSLHTDASIIRVLLSAVSEGEFEALKSVEADLRSLQVEITSAEHIEPSSTSIRERLHRLLQSSPEISSEAKIAVAEDALRFVEREGRSFLRIREERALTPAEKKQVRDILSPVIDQLAEWFDVPTDPTQSQSQS